MIEHCDPSFSMLMELELRNLTSSLAAPNGIAAPSLTSTSPTAVLITWTDPQYPNGVLVQFGIERRTPGGEEVTLVQVFLPSDPKEYLDQSPVITPATEYEYRIKVMNDADTGYGPWASVITRASSEFIQPFCNRHKS